MRMFLQVTASRLINQEQICGGMLPTGDLHKNSPFSPQIKPHPGDYHTLDIDFFLNTFSKLLSWDSYREWEWLRIDILENCTL